MLEKTYVTKALISPGIVKKKIRNMCYTNRIWLISKLCYVCGSPPGNFCQFLRLFEIMFMSLYRPKTEFVICGDVNIDFLSYSYRKQQLSQLLGLCTML
jgi:hypothetical protein